MSPPTFPLHCHVPARTDPHLPLLLPFFLGGDGVNFFSHSSRYKPNPTFILCIIESMREQLPNFRSDSDRSDSDRSDSDRSDPDRSDPDRSDSDRSDPDRSDPDYIERLKIWKMLKDNNIKIKDAHPNVIHRFLEDRTVEFLVRNNDWKYIEENLLSQKVKEYHGEMSLIGFAVRHGKLEIVKKLLSDMGSGVFGSVKEDWEVVKLAAENRDSIALKMLLDAVDEDVKVKGRADVLNTVSHDGYADMAKLLLDQTKLFSEDGKGPSPLMRAAFWGRLEVVKLLIEHGASVNYQDNKQETALMTAAERGHKEVVEALLRAGADKNVQTGDGKTAYTYAKTDEIKRLLRPKRWWGR